MCIVLKCVVLVFISTRSCVLGAPMITTTATMDYLQRYGYVDPRAPNMFEGIANFQKMMHMKPTGTMDKATSEAMHKPRCGMPDMSRNKKIKGGRWEKNELTYKLMNYPKSDRSLISPSNVDLAIKEAFKIWEDATNLKFTLGGDNDIVDISISFEIRDHIPNHSRFDGPTPEGMELAHAGYPTLPDENLRGDIHFDDEEIWTMKSRDANQFNILYVAAHEIGHSLGLAHTEKEAIMEMMYKNMTKVQLYASDKQRIQELYGEKIKITGRTAMHDICDDPSIDAALNAADGSTYVIASGYYWILTATGLAKSGYPQPVGSMWVKGPSRIDSAFTNNGLGMTFLLQGNQVWRYKNLKGDWTGTLKQGFKIPITSVDAVLRVESQQLTYFFKGNMFYAKSGSSLSNGLIAEKFKGVPDNLDAAVMYKRKENQPADPVFFKGIHCYYRLYQTTPGKPGKFTTEYIKAETKRLFACPQ